MEIAVFCCVGILASLCLGLALAGEGRGAGAGAAACTRDPAGALLAVAHRVGSGIWELGVLPASWADDLRAEVAELAAKRGLPASGIDRGTALGAVATACVLSALALFFVSQALPALLLGALAPVVALAIARVRRRTRGRRELEEALPEAFGALSVSLGSGYSLPQAMLYVGQRSPEPLRSAFTRVSFSVDCGIPAVEALDAMLAGLRAPGLDLVVLALKVSQRTGAPLNDLLAQATRLVGERIELRRRLEVKTSQARMSARMVACMPVAMTGLLSLLSSDFRAGLATASGAGSVAVALVLNVAAWIAIRRIMDIEL